MNVPPSLVLGGNGHFVSPTNPQAIIEPAEMVQGEKQNNKTISISSPPFPLYSPHSLKFSFICVKHTETQELQMYSM
jgi:hypothetical protein